MSWHIHSDWSFADSDAYGIDTDLDSEPNSSWHDEMRWDRWDEEDWRDDEYRDEEA